MTPVVIKRILIPLDGSRRSAGIIPLAREIARRHGAEVVLLHVVEPPWRGLEYHMTAALPSLAARAKEVLDPQRRRLRGIRVRTRAVVGHAACAILEAARREGADLIAMTSRGRRGLPRLALGSVAERVLRGAPCPVLLARAGP